MLTIAYMLWTNTQKYERTSGKLLIKTDETLPQWVNGLYKNGDFFSVDLQGATVNDTNILGDGI